MSPVPRKSAITILTRETDDPGLEVFLLKRSLKSNFMAGNYVCPGGNVDERDEDPAILPFCRGEDGRLSKEELPFRVAGVRELFEEAGILMACRRLSGAFDVEEDAAKERFRAYRADLQRGRTGMRAVAEQEDLLLLVDELLPFAHWITPEARPVRFDAHFFICPCPLKQVATADERETTAGVWISPEAALRANMAGAMVLSPPTISTLEDMLPFRSLEELSRSLKDKPVIPVLPVFVDMGTESVVVFPWDRDFERIARGDSGRIGDHGRLSAPGDRTTRVVLRGGRNLPYCRD
jgi:8-oxo-dGTP pyrophosphatase MutT (NUDIX family)